MKDTLAIVPSKFRKYVGNRPPIACHKQRAQQLAFSLVTECLADGRTPFSRMAQNGVMLNDETASYLYDGDYGFTAEPYRKGSKPILEAYLNAMVDDSMSDAEKVITLCQAMHDLPQRYGETPSFLYGESDEETLLKGGGHCSCMGRVMCALCQILGIPARPAMMWVNADPRDPSKLIGGHTVNEIHLNGQWGFFDPMGHVYCQTKDGRFPSIREIVANPELFTRMPESIAGPMNPWLASAHEDMNRFEYYAHRFFTPNVTISITRHEVMDREAVIRWSWATKEFREKQDHDYKMNKRILLPLGDRGELTDEIYAMNVAEFRAHFGVEGKLPGLWNRAPAREREVALIS